MPSSAAPRYEAREPVERPLAVGLGVQLAVLSLSSAVVLPTIVFRAAGAEEFLLWAVFADGHPWQGLRPDRSWEPSSDSTTQGW